MKGNLNHLVLIILTGALMFNLSGCNSQNNQGNNDDVESGIVNYDLTFEILPAEGIFYSKQQITITADLVKDNTLSIFLSSNLIVDNLVLEDDKGNDFPLSNWYIKDSYEKEYFWGVISLYEIEIQPKQKLPTEGLLVVTLDYRLPAEFFQQGKVENIYDLFVSTNGMHAGGPESGAFPMVSGNLEAPFRITIRHPKSWRCVLPGEIAEFEESGEYRSVTYEAKQAYDPSFSCTPFQVLQTEVEGMNFEIYAPANMDLSLQMLSDGAEILSFYTTNFGHPLADSFRIVFHDIENSNGGGESNGNMVILGDITPYMTYDESARDSFTSVVAHEGYHLWNTWSVHWQGKLTEWWVEGGATFMSHWAKETLYGSEAGANIRLQDLQVFDEQQAYLHPNTLATLDESWFDDWALVYVYGAQVWEQLRLSIGDGPLKAGLKEFYDTYSGQTADYDDLITCIRKQTHVNVDTILKQWTEQNAKVNLAIKTPTIREVNGYYQTEVDVDVQSDSDFQIFTSLGYRTASDTEWQLVNLQLQQAGLQTVAFESDERPIIIQIDPEYRVPQVDMSDNIWEK